MSTLQRSSPDPEVPSHLECGVHCWGSGARDREMILSTKGCGWGMESPEVGVKGREGCVRCSPPSVDGCLEISSIC